MIRLGIITSNYTSGYIEIIRSIKDFHLEGIYSPCWGKHRSLTKKYDVPVYFDMENLLEVTDAILIIGKENWYPLAVEAIKQSKHLFIGSPFTLALKETETLIKLVHEAETKVWVSHPYSLNPAFLALSNYIQQPLFVEIVNHYASNNNNVNPCLVGQSMIYDLSLLLYIVKSGVKRINTAGVSGKGNCPDMVNVRIEFNNGCVANLTTSRLGAKRKHKYLLYQQDELLSINFLKNTSVNHTIDNFKNKTARRKNIFASPSLIKDMDYTRKELVGFCNYICYKSPPIIKLEDAYYSLQLADEIIDRVNRTVLQMEDC